MRLSKLSNHQEKDHPELKDNLAVNVNINDLIKVKTFDERIRNLRKHLSLLAK